MGVIPYLSSSSSNSIRCCPPIPRPSQTSGTPTTTDSMSRIFMFSTGGILGVQSWPGNLCFQRLFLFPRPQLDIFSRHFSWCRAITHRASSSLSVRHWAHERTALPQMRFPIPEYCSQCCIMLLSPLCSLHVDRDELLSSTPGHQKFVKSLHFPANVAVHKNHGTTVGSQVEILIDVLCVQFLVHCTELCVHQRVVHTEIDFGHFLRGIEIAKLHRRESTHHWVHSNFWSIHCPLAVCFTAKALQSHC